MSMVQKVANVGVEVEVDCDTTKVDDAVDKLEQLSELTSDLAPMVSIRNCRGCTFNIYPSRNSWIEGEGCS